jgi:glucuronokinase
LIVPDRALTGADAAGADPADAIIERCPARAALAGNPSDGYGGAVVSIPVPCRSATVTITPAGAFEICHSPTPDDTFDSWDAVDRHVDRFGFTASRELVLASLRRFARHTSTTPPVCAITVDSTIPRSVGLAGSSAIVIATLRALFRLAALDPVGPDELASLALAVEVDELGYAAGLQDRVVQVYDQPVLMRFGPHDERLVNGLLAGTYHPLSRPLPGTVFVAYRADEAEPSQAVHGDLRHRFERGEAAVLAGMADLAAVATDAADAITAGDADRLGRACDATFDIRRSMMDLRLGHVAMVDAARRAGAHANFAGSGGAVIVLAPDGTVADRARDALHRIGCEILPIDHQ